MITSMKTPVGLLGLLPLLFPGLLLLPRETEGLNIKETFCNVLNTEETFQHFIVPWDKGPKPKSQQEELDAYYAGPGTIPLTGIVMKNVTDAQLHDNELILRHISYSALTYCSSESAAGMSGVVAGPKRLPLAMGTFEMTHNVTVDDLAYDVFVNTAQNYAILAFRGTANVANAKRDLDKELVTPDPALYPGLSTSGSGDVGKAHKGFQESTQILQNGTLGYTHALQEVMAAHPGMEYIVTGHSLGGALAFTAGANLALTTQFTQLPAPRAVYTYGQPEVGQTTLANALAKAIGPSRVIRVVSSDDVVPHMLDNKGDGVRHAENVNETWMPDPMHWKVVECQGSQDSNCSSSISCSDRSWDHHSWYGGFWAGRRFCTLSTVPEVNDQAENLDQPPSAQDPHATKATSHADASPNVPVLLEWGVVSLCSFAALMYLGA
ncbi:Alpha/Beta hydrolase protein [Piptocephalis cylindrospora]|uniref:Alpha/Beta hydrolase protein n=1 Tax=Piptocephalis cylindrospora TaxID=1907219 RepID=A0A4P9Y0P1_9FUNG|nr:Alpha/Beta hydrolase protein [Piptocephalis cylindrospora]|eukprot:RKP11340.1 Alpha/Beta hydrolase protein [Piptocephalis cylindrospora]